MLPIFNKAVLWGSIVALSELTFTWCNLQQRVEHCYSIPVISLLAGGEAAGPAVERREHTASQSTLLTYLGRRVFLLCAKNKSIEQNPYFW